MVGDGWGGGGEWNYLSLVSRKRGFKAEVCYFPPNSVIPLINDFSRQIKHKVKSISFIGLRVLIKLKIYK